MLENILHLRPVLGSYISFSAPFYALLAAVFLLVFFRLLGLLKRQGRFRQAVVNLYYVYLPFVLVLCASAWMLSVGAERHVVMSMEELRAPLISLSTKSFEQAWDGFAATDGSEPVFAVDAVAATVAGDYTQIFLEGGQEAFEKHRLMEILNTAAPGLRIRLEGHLAKEVLSVAQGKDEVQLSTLQAEWQTEVKTQLGEGLGVDLLLDEIRYNFITFFKKIQMLFLLLTIPVIVEIGYALYQRPPLQDN